MSKYYLAAERHARSWQIQLGHNDLQKSRIAWDEADVKSLTSMLDNHWINPFSSEQQDAIICLSTGQVATPKIEEDLLNAKAVGEKAYEEFRKQRLESNPPEVKFHDTLKKSKLLTFSELTKKVKINGKANEISLKTDRARFGEMVIIAQKRQLRMKDVLCHPLGPLPWSLATADGSLRKSNKSTLAKELQKNVPAADSIPSHLLVSWMGWLLSKEFKATIRSLETLQSPYSTWYCTKEQPPTE